MVLFLTKKGEKIALEDIDYSVWLFILVQLESGEYAIVSFPANQNIYHDQGLYFLENLMPDLKVRREMGGGVITVMPPSWSKLPQIDIRFCLDQCYRQPDWSIVEQTLRQAFPEVSLLHWPK